MWRSHYFEMVFILLTSEYNRFEFLNSMHPLRSTLITRTISKMLVGQQKKQEILAYFSENYPNLLWNSVRTDRIKSCCNVLRFINYWNDTKLVKWNFCKYDKICIACATRRSIKMIQHFIQGIEKHNLQDKHWYHIVLTIRHKKSDTLNHLIERLMKHKLQLTQSVRNSKRTSQSKTNFFSQFQGTVSSIEVTHGKNWRHPHLHLLVCWDIDIPVEFSSKLQTLSNRELQKERFKLTGDSFCVAMRKLDVTKDHFDRQWIAEVFKYAVKFSSLELPQLAELIALQNAKQHRFYATTGIFRGWDKNTAKTLPSYLSDEEVEYVPYLSSSDFTFDEKTGIYHISTS